MKRAGLLLVALLSIGCGSSDTSPIRVRIPVGATVRSVADSLKAHKLISVKSWFRLRARLSHVDRVIKPGLYEFTKAASVGDILDRLKRGDAVHVRLTLPEGATLYDLAKSVEEKLGIPTDSLLRASADTAFLRSLRLVPPVDSRGPRVSSAEGWLLPQTFDFEASASPRDILERFVAARLAAWDSTWDARAEAAGFNRVELLTLASIVEAEALHKEELPSIAAVYRNRIRIGMALQADPTIQYGYLVKDGHRKERLYNKDYTVESPWNTYHYRGLPPGPIGNPTREAIEAVLSPAPVKYLYFVAGQDGRHQFSVDYLNHQRAIRKVRGRG